MCLLQGEGVQCTTAFYCSAPAPPLSVVFRFAYSCSLSVAAMVGFHTKFIFAHHGESVAAFRSTNEQTMWHSVLARLSMR